ALLAIFPLFSTPWCSGITEVRKIKISSKIFHFLMIFTFRSGLNNASQKSLLRFNEEGYSVLKGFFSQDQVDEINTEIENY
ncbi:MAG: hypothetical protein ACI9FN_003474, partial [Saprospiraceae bacterium]